MPFKHPLYSRSTFQCMYVDLKFQITECHSLLCLQTLPQLDTPQVPHCTQNIWNTRSLPSWHCLCRHLHLSACSQLYCPPTAYVPAHLQCPTHRNFIYIPGPFICGNLQKLRPLKIKHYNMVLNTCSTRRSHSLASL